MTTRIAVAVGGPFGAWRARSYREELNAPERFATAVGGVLASWRPGVLASWRRGSIHPQRDPLAGARADYRLPVNTVAIDAIATNIQTRQRPIGAAAY